MVHKIRIEDQEIIDGILKNDSETIKLIYRNNFNRIKSMVIGFKNISIEPDDVFQEGLTRAIINIRKGIFKGESSFATYLFGICRNLCLKEYNRNKPITGIGLDEFKEDISEDFYDEIQLVLKLKNLLDDQCKRIIDLRFGLSSDAALSTRFEAIAESLGINADNARQRFRRCFAKLKSLIKENQEINQLIF